MPEEMNLGINTTGLSKSVVAELGRSIAGAIKANEDNYKAEAANIQRRGNILPGDTGQHFGMHNNLQGHGFSFFPRDFSDQFSGEFSRFGIGGFGHGHSSIQGSMSTFSGSTRMAQFKMSLCVEAYKGFGVAKNVIDLMANFAAEGLTLKHKSKAVQKFYERWAEHVGLRERVQQILRYYYKYGNVFIYTTMGLIDSLTYDRMKRAKSRDSLKGFVKVDTVADNNDPAQPDRLKDIDEEKRKTLDKRQIPWRYTMLNPFQMDLRGNKFFGESEWVFILDPMTAKTIQSGGLKTRNGVDFLDETDINLPPEFKKLSDEGDNSMLVTLDPAKLWTLHYMKDDHEDWADPLLWPVMADIFYKNKLRQMDVSVCDSVINAVTIFKLGDFANGFIPPEEHMRAFAEFLRAPTAAMNMVWNDAISIESSYPPVDKILGVAKYEAVDRDILRGLGIPDTLLGGTTGASFSTGFLGVRTLLERLEEGRNAVITWLNRQLRMIAAIMGHRDIPKVKFGKMSLRDEKAEKMLVLQLLDRNIISIEAVLEAFGEDFEIEIERLRDEEVIREQTGLLKKHSPFVDPINDMDAEETMDKQAKQKQEEIRLNMKFKQAEQKAQKNQKGQKGRPVNTKGIPQENKRETKPQGMAWLLDWESTRNDELVRIEAIYDIVTSMVLKAKGKRYKKSLSKKDRDGIESISFAAASYLEDEVSSSAVLNVLADELTRGYHPEILSRYEQVVSDTATLDDKKQAMATAIASYRMGV